MLALAAIIAGSVITGYSAYKIHAIQRGRDRKLRDMEVLRRLNIPPKKQVRVWGFLMVLGLVLLTPGLGYLLSIDPISGSGSDAPYSNLRATPSGNPATVPLSENLDKTPRTVEKDESGRTFFFASSGGGSKKSSSGGGRTTSGSSSSENNTGVSERSSEDPDNDTRPSGGDYSIRYASEANETAEILETESSSTGQKIDAQSETNATSTEFEDGKGKTEPPAPTEIETVTEKTSAERASETSEVAGKIEPALAEASTETAIIEAAPEKSTVPSAFGYSSDEIEPGSTPAEKSTAPVVIEAAPEKSTVPHTPKYPIAETVTGPAPIETSTEPAATEADLDDSRSPDARGSSEMGDEFGSPLPTPSSEPRDSEVESDLPANSPSSAASNGGDEPDLSWLTSIIENPAKSGISELPAAPAPDTRSRTDEVKKLVFEEDPTSQTNGTGNDSGEKNEEADDLLPNLGGLFSDLNTSSGASAFGGESDFNSKFQDFTSKTQPEMGMDKNGTLNSVSIMEFETIDLKSNFRSGSGLTPTSPFG